LKPLVFFNISFSALAFVSHFGSKAGSDVRSVKAKKYFTLPQISLACQGFDPIVPKLYQGSLWPDLGVLDRICINFRDQI
jgi:hypothetical protein